MKQLVSDAVISVMSNPMSAELEVVHCEAPVRRAVRAVEQSVASAGGVIVNRFDGATGLSRFVDPPWACVFFRGRPDGVGTGRDRLLTDPVVQAIIETDGDGGVWIRFDASGAPYHGEMPLNAA
ncbi:hypothetical protein [Arenibacterium halophilum]|uniref:Uncharacterized protein n=1 Tax=Arenibacterium halophilum TaxID=2583821 RepID=A0ABY2XAJ1_9RHOB|nr:hypothetical protein [Arenibacterium halophilum]TMV13008.1 hypothetical protein FGK64_09460 [Arenibacterium halophilum]